MAQPSLSLPTAGGQLTLDPIAPTDSPSQGLAPSSESTPAGLGRGIGMAALAALLLQPLVGDRLARAALALLGAEETTTCPRGGTP